MLIIPAIDLYDHHCVRLHKGRYDEKTIYSSDPLDQAKKFEDQGATHLHLVDLEAAKTGDIVHLDVLESIKNGTQLMVDFGGGIRTVKQGMTCINAGADQINVGTMAVKSPGEFEALMQKAGKGKIILSADRDGDKLKTDGWIQEAAVSFWSFIDNFVRIGGKFVTSTDISKDGTLTGIDVAGYADIWTKYPTLHVVVSGGVGQTSDVIPLFKTPAYGVIIGKALYEGKIDLKSLIHQSKTANNAD